MFRLWSLPASAHDVVSFTSLPAVPLSRPPPPPLYSSHLLITGQQRLAQLLLLLFHASSKPAPSDQSVVSASIYTLSASLHSTTTVTIR